jgi:hypothetical protein
MMNNIVLVAAATAVVSSIASSHSIEGWDDNGTGYLRPVFCGASPRNEVGNSCEYNPKEDDLVEYINKYGNPRRRFRLIGCKTS